MSATDFDIALQDNQQERSISAKSDRRVSGFAVRASAKSDVRGCKKVTTQNHRFCHKPGVAEAFNRPCGAITCPNWVTLCFLALLILDLVLLMGWNDFQLMP